MNRKKANLISFASIIVFVLLIFICSWITIIFISLNINSLILLSSFTVLYILQSIVAFFIFNSKRIVNVKLCWVFIIYFLPLFGMAFFLMFGIIPLSIKNFKDSKLKNKDFHKYEDYKFTKRYIKENELNDFAFAYNFNKSPIYKNNEYTFIEQNVLMKTSIDLIKSAKEFIHIHYYIISDCVWFEEISKALIEKAQENIKIRFMYDWAGSYKRIRKSSIQKLKNAGIEIEVFNPKTFNLYTSNTNFRSHRKGIIIDNRKCLTGGSNIGDEYLNLRKNYNNWMDLNFIVEGEIVNSLNLSFCYDWINYSSYSFKKEKDINFYKNFKIFKSTDENISQVINSSPNISINPFLQILSSMFILAKKTITIVTPYFLLHDSIISSLMYASIKGVKVKIILPNAPDDKKYILTINRSNYKKLLDANIEIYEYIGFMHSKIIIIDDNISIVGTNNMDFRSLLINFETAILIDSKKTNEKLDKICIDYINNSILIKEESLKILFSQKEKMKMNLINIIHPLL